MNSDFQFKTSQFGSVGVEIELQLIDLATHDLSNAARALLARCAHRDFDIKPEITQSMLEIATRPHTSDATLRRELRDIAAWVTTCATQEGLGIAGGGAHPFHNWKEREVYPAARYLHLQDQFGYLARKFTVFGMHVHVGCTSGDEALRVLHGLSRYAPLLIALSASSPHRRGVETGFDSSRLHDIDVFPTSGAAPFALSWDAFTNDYLLPMRERGMAQSLKDYYWDIRPKPEYGTVEVRVCDAPLSVERAADLAALIRVLATHVAYEAPVATAAEQAVYRFNRFEAARVGLDASYIEPIAGGRMTLRRFGAETLLRCAALARAQGAGDACRRLLDQILTGENDAARLRHTVRAQGDVRASTRLALAEFAKDDSTEPPLAASAA